MLVPDSVAYPVSTVVLSPPEVTPPATETMSDPGAKISTHGPKLLNPEVWSAASVAPTVIA